MKAKYLITALLTAAMAAPVLYAAEEGPEPRPPVEKKEMRRGLRRGPREANRPSRELLDAVRIYREQPTEENKAKVRAVVEKEFDANIQKEEKRLAEMKSKKAEHIDKRLERVLKRGEKRGRPDRKRPGGPGQPPRPSEQ